MKIRFLGLVAHVTRNPGSGNEYQLAALPAAPNHTATLSVRKNSVLDADGIGKTSGGQTCFPIMGCVKFTDLGSGKAGKLSIDEVPSLLDPNVTNGTAGTLNLKIYDCPPDPGLFSAVVYVPPGGRMVAEDYFKYEVDFHGVAHGPLPHTVLYLVVTTADIKIEIPAVDRVHNIVLALDSEIVIANVCQDSAGNHFQNYSFVFDPPATVYDPDDSKKRPCAFHTPPPPLPKCAKGADLGVDCSNSHFP
jgi:hypothetical protein